MKMCIHSSSLFLIVLFQLFTFYSEMWFDHMIRKIVIAVLKHMRGIHRINDRLINRKVVKWKWLPSALILALILHICHLSCLVCHLMTNSIEILEGAAWRATQGGLAWASSFHESWILNMDSRQCGRRVQKDASFYQWEIDQWEGSVCSTRVESGWNFSFMNFLTLCKLFDGEFSVAG